MQEELHYKGIWFLPEKPDQQIHGDLYYSPLKGIELKLLGVFETEKTPFILGISADGKLITLYKAERFGRGFSSNGFETSEYGAIFMFIGREHIRTSEELNFSRINCTWIDFDVWLGVYGFKKPESKKATKEIIVEYKQPENILFDISDEMNCEFKFGTHTPGTSKVSKYFIEQRCAVCFAPKAGTASFEVLFDCAESFYRLMSLAYFEESRIKDMSVWQNRPNEENETYTVELQVYYQSEVTEARYKKHDNDYSFLFTFKDVKDNFETILKKWYKAEAVMDPVISGLAESFAKRTHATEFKFLNLAHSVETLHRRTKKRMAVDPLDFKEKLNQIIGSVDEKYRDWLKEKLAYSNELTLQERLTELISQVPEPIQKVLFKPSIEEFIKQFKNSRNYYTHYDKNIEKKALKGGKLYLFSERVKIFLICLVLKEIGFTEEEVVKTIFRSGVKLFNHIIKYEDAKVHFNNWQ